MATSLPGAPADGDLTELIMDYQRREFALLSHMAQHERQMKSLQQKSNEAVREFEDAQKDSLRGALVDPVVNMEVAMLRQLLKEKDQEIEKLKSEAQSTQFQPNSIQGQKLFQKCAHLVDENSELGRQLGEERLQILRIELAAENKKKRLLEKKLKAYEEKATQLDAEIEAFNRRVAEIGQSLARTTADIAMHREEIEDIQQSKASRKQKRTESQKRSRAEAKKARQQAAQMQAEADAAAQAAAAAAAAAEELVEVGSEEKREEVEDVDAETPTPHASEEEAEEEEDRKEKKKKSKKHKSKKKKDKVSGSEGDVESEDKESAEEKQEKKRKSKKHKK